MPKRTCKFAWSACVALGFVCVPAALAQNASPATDPVPLTIPPGTPLLITLTKKVPVKHVGTPVEGKVAENVYVFDHLVIPAGSPVLGTVAKVDHAPRKAKALALANGNFTPLRRAEVDFNALVEPDGKRLPLQTQVQQGAPPLVRATAGEHAKKPKGRIAGKVDQLQQQVKDQGQAAINDVTAPGKVQRLKSALAARLPYHRPMLPAGTSFTAELKAPLTFGAEIRSPQQLQKIGGPIPPGSLVHVRLVTPLSSAIDHRDTPVRGVVSQPLFSSQHELILPQGTRLSGSVIESVPARRFGRNGQLRFTFRQMDVGSKAPRNVEASLQGVDASSGTHLQLDAEGGAHAVTPKSSYVMPAIEVFLASTSMDLDGDHRGINASGAGQGADYAGAGIKGGVSLGLAGAVITLLVHSRPVTSSFAFYGAGWAVYSHFVARGNDVVFPKNTPMEIRFGTHENPPAPKPAKPATQTTAAPAKPPA